MDIKIKKLWAADQKARERHLWHKKRNIRNWPIHKMRALAVFECFAHAAREHGQFFGVIDQIRKPEAPDEVGIFHYGQDHVSLIFPSRPTGELTVTQSWGGGVYSKREREAGASLAIHFSEHNGVFQTFLFPPKYSALVKEKRGVLIDFSFNMDNLTPDYSAKMIRKLLIFNRVESILESSTLLERWRVRWWRFIDVRNRKGIGEKAEHLLTPWEMIVLAALLAIFGSSAVLKGIPYLWQLLNPFL